MGWGTILLSGIVGLFVLFPLAFVWYVNVGGMMTGIKNRGMAKKFKEAPSNLACSVDSDCPPGYACLDGRCVLAR
jgi:hypothetical protein